MPVARLLRRAAARTKAEGCRALELGLSPHSYAAFFAPGRHEHLLIPTLRPDQQPAAFAGPSMGPEPLAVASDSFGVALLIDVLWRLTDPQRLLAEANRCLHHDGRLYAATPLVVQAPSALRPDRLEALGVNGLLETAGFSVVEHRPLRNRDDYGVVARKTTARPEPAVAADLGRSVTGPVM